MGDFFLFFLCLVSRLDRQGCACLASEKRTCACKPIALHNPDHLKLNPWGSAWLACGVGALADKRSLPTYVMYAGQCSNWAQLRCVLSHEFLNPAFQSTGLQDTPSRCLWWQCGRQPHMRSYVRRCGLRPLWGAVFCQEAQYSRDILRARSETLEQLVSQYGLQQAINYITEEEN